MKRNYHTIDKDGKVGERKLTEFLVHNGQALLPMLELIEQSHMAIDEMIDVMGRSSIEAVLRLSAVQVAGPPQQGKARQPDIVWHGTQPGRVCLKETQGAGEQAAVAQEGPWRGQGSTDSGLSGVATGRGHRGAHAQDPVERRFHAMLSASDPGDGRHGGRFAIQREPGNDRSFRGGAAAVAGTAIRQS